MLAVSVKSPGGDIVDIIEIQGLKTRMFHVRAVEQLGQAAAAVDLDGLRRLRDGITGFLGEDAPPDAGPYRAQGQIPVRDRWRYASVNIFGNAHDAVRVINEKHREWDVIAMSMDGENGTQGSVTLVVYRTRETPTPEDPRRRTVGATDGGA